MGKYPKCTVIWIATCLSLVAEISFAQVAGGGWVSEDAASIRANAANPELRPHPPDAPHSLVIGIKGQISKNTVKKLSQSILQEREDPIPAGLIVLLDSPGGDGMAAMQLGQLLRQANAHVVVTGECSSACIFVLAGGVVRVAPSYSVGIHRGRITMSDANAKIIKEVDVRANPAAKAALQHFEREAPLFFEAMGMSPELFPLMQSHQLKGVFRLSASEISKMGLSGFDSHYLDRRVAVYQQRGNPFPADHEELKKRTMRVASRCSGFEKQHSEFIRCYRETLQNPFVN
ncbi:MAG: hypothetical protein Q8R65_01655 [Polynucleobacter sp.]|nr:hypothetical protein [Polynucleobacter sp.]MDZ4056429.1 hypothetical protein [Polynucleobacter sp.]